MKTLLSHFLLFIMSAMPIVSFSQAQQISRSNINLPRDQASTRPFNEAVLVGNTLYISGRLGMDPKTGKIPADLKDEIRLILDGYKVLLDQAKMTMDNLVYVTIYCPDLTLYDVFNEVYRTYFNKDLPARAFIGSGPLLRGAHFEMQGIAVKP
jgi:2-iminobutanoate/2-iminopropanoate deaminase